MAQRAHVGLLRARADLMVIGGGDRHSDVLVPAEFWWAEGESALQQNWEVGDFSTWIDRRVQIKVFGVRFLRRDILQMLPARLALAEPSPPREPAGRPMSALWPGWVAELVAYIHEHGIPEGAGSAGADQLIERVCERLAERGLDAPARSTLLSTAKAVLRRLRDGN